MKKRSDFESKMQPRGQKRQWLRLVEVRYMPTPDANLRLCRAIDILLKAAASEGARREHQCQREEDPLQDSQPEGSN